MVNANWLVGVKVILYNAHRLNSVTIWNLRIGGSERTCKNPEMERFMKLAVCVGVLCHLAVNGDELKDIQTLHEDFYVVYELIRQTTRSKDEFRFLYIDKLQIPLLHENI